jgi:hypothetical protein
MPARIEEPYHIQAIKDIIAGSIGGVVRRWSIT